MFVKYLFPCHRGLYENITAKIFSTPGRRRDLAVIFSTGAAMTRETNISQTLTLLVIGRFSLSVYPPGADEKNGVERGRLAAIGSV